jgi:hypothetical protein
LFPKALRHRLTNDAVEEEHDGIRKEFMRERILMSLPSATLFRLRVIEWIWIVEQRRRATPQEIRQLCHGKWKPLRS